MELFTSLTMDTMGNLEVNGYSVGGVFMGMKGTFSILPQIALEPISEDLESKKNSGGHAPRPP